MQRCILGMTLDGTRITRLDLYPLSERYGTGCYVFGRGVASGYLTQISLQYRS